MIITASTVDRAPFKTYFDRKQSDAVAMCRSRNRMEGLERCISKDPPVSFRMLLVQNAGLEQLQRQVQSIACQSLQHEKEKPLSIDGQQSLT